MNRQKQALSALTLMLVMLIPGSLAANTNREHAEISRWLSSLEMKSADLRREAAQLESLNRSMASWHSHSRYLNNVKEHVNYMGQTVADLHDLKSAASEEQQRAIEAATPRLKSIAENTEKAIRMLNEDRSMTTNPEYRDILATLHSETAELYDSLDAFNDYRAAKQRLAVSQ